MTNGRVRGRSQWVTSEGSDFPFGTATQAGMLPAVNVGIRNPLKMFNLALALLAVTLCAAALLRHHSARQIAASPLDQNVAELEFENVAFSDVMDFFHDIYHLEFRVDWNALNEWDVTGSTAIGVHLHDESLGAAIDKVLAAADGNLAFELEGNVVRVTTSKNLPRVVRAYDVSDFLPPAAPTASKSTAATAPTVAMATYRALPRASADGKPPTRAEVLEATARLVQETITPDQWVDAGGSECALWASADRLVVLDSREGHRRIAALLRLLRAADAGRSWQKPLVPATRPAAGN
ncbi:MAG: hypothetical protein JWN51_3537 [Phycisphaerales bacterium]|nr:hypothetical protein [Phycisphaerales bacterium]